jgi:hypothetical protein
MSKTPPLVIPVVIDGTGVNRGLNNVNSRLRRGVSGGASGSGFGSGGGDALAIAGAAGIGAGIGAFGSSASRMNAASQPSSAFRARMDTQSKRFMRNRFRGSSSYGIAGQDYLFRMGEEAYDAYDPISERGQAFRDAHSRVTRAANERELYRASATRRSFARKVKSVGRGIGASVGGMTAAKAALGSLGIAAAAKKGVDVLTNLGQYADPESVIGNPYYGALRGITIREAQRNQVSGKPMGFTQSVLAGFSLGAGGKTSSIEMLGNKLGRFIQDMGVGYGLTRELIFRGYGVDVVKTMFGDQGAKRNLQQAMLNRQSN